MPSLLAGTGTPWQSGAPLLGSLLAAPWQNGASLLSTGGTYTPGSPPVGGTPTTPGVGAARFRIRPAAHYLAVGEWELLDARDETPLHAERVTLAITRDDAFWQLQAEGLPETARAQLLQGEQPARVRFTAGWQVWEFVVDVISRPRRFEAQQRVGISGRSLAALAAAPFQASQNFTNDGASSASQMAAAVLLFSGITADWQVESWGIPDRVFNVSGTPVQAVRALADAIGAIVTSHPSQPVLQVLPSYPALPNEWRTGGVDVDIALDAVLSDAMERVESTQYDGVYLAGQQGGMVGYVRIDGTAGGRVAPFLTDPLLTDLPALRQRGQAILGGATGAQVSVPLELPVLHGTDHPGVLALNQMLRVQDPADVWYGLVRGVSATFEPGRATQQVTCERHLALWEGSVAADPVLDPLVFEGPIDDQAPTVGASFSLATAGEWSGGTAPYTWSVRSGALPAGLSLNAATGVISGTPTTAGTTTGFALRCVDADGGMADSNAFDFDVTSGAALTYQVKLKFEENSPGSWFSQITNPGSWGDSAVISTGTTGAMDVVASPVAYGSKSLKLTNPGASPSRRAEVSPLSLLDLAAGDVVTLGCQFLDDGSAPENLTLFDLRWVSGVIEFQVVGGFNTLGAYLSLAVIDDGVVVQTDSVSVGTPMSSSAFTHAEFSLAPGAFRLFVGGALIGTITPVASFAGACTRGRLFRCPSGNTGSVMHLDEFFLLLGTSPLHTSAFTPGPLP